MKNKYWKSPGEVREINQSEHVGTMIVYTHVHSFIYCIKKS